MRVYHSATTARVFCCGAERGTRTLTALRPPVFETGASTDSAISACEFVLPTVSILYGFAPGTGNLTDLSPPAHRQHKLLARLYRPVHIAELVRCPRH